MNKRIAFLAFIILSLTVFISCRDNELVNDPAFCSTAWTVAIESEAEDLSLAEQAYASDPNFENCAAYKVALHAYVNALKPYRDCTAFSSQQRAELEAEIAKAETGIDDIEC